MSKPPSSAPKVPAPPAGSGESGRRQAWACAAIFLLTLAAYWPAIGGGFIWDDDRHVTKLALRSLDGLRRIWFELGATQQYYPVLHSAFWFEHRLWGDNPLGYHLLNVLLHATSACLFVLVLKRLTGAKGWPWLAGLIFALHPVCVESVAWVSEQKNTLSTVFYLLSALTYLRWSALTSERSGTRKRFVLYCLATLLFILALLSKTVTATLPAALLVVIWWRNGRLDWKKDILPLLPWLALGVSAGLFTAWVERRFIGAEGEAFNLSFLERGLLASRVIWFYLGKLLWPANLDFIYPRWQVSAAAAGQYLYPAAALALLALLVREVRRTRAPLAGFLFFVGTLVPALGFVNVYPFVYSYVADHFQYLASLGIIALAAGGWSALTSERSGTRQRFVNGGAVVILSLLGILTWRQCRTYRSAEILYRSTLAKNPDCWMAEVNLGKILHESGRTAESIPHFEAGVRLRPEAKSYFDLGNALLDAGRLDEARARYDEALRREPRLGPDLAMGYNNLGNAYFRAKREAEARDGFEEALRLRPDYAKARNGLGGVYFRDGRMLEAAREFEEAIRLDPAYAEAHLNLGIALSRLGRVHEAIAECEQAVRLRPGFTAARNFLRRLREYESSHP